MNPGERLYGLAFHHEHAADAKVESLSRDLVAFVCDCDRHFAIEREPSGVHFKAERLHIDRLFVSRPKCTMNTDCTPDHTPAHPLHLRRDGLVDDVAHIYS